MNDQIKFRYVLKDLIANEIYFKFFTIQELEQGEVRIISTNCEIIRREMYVGNKDKSGKDIYQHDIVKVRCRRVSGSYGNWCKEINVNHGYYYIDMVVLWDPDRLKFYLKVFNKYQIKELEKPIGKERYEQQIMYPMSFNDLLCWYDNDIEVIGYCDEI